MLSYAICDIRYTVSVGRVSLEWCLRHVLVVFVLVPQVSDPKVRLRLSSEHLLNLPHRTIVIQTRPVRKRETQRRHGFLLS